ncbi:MAG: MFS transporter, partial [Pseudomonadota bacterium]
MFSSSFGQTFFISIFAGEIRETFGLTHGQWGGIYTLGTLASAAVMLWAGGLADRIPAQRLGASVMVLLALTCLCMAVVPQAVLLPLVIFGLRFCGQGMLGHIAIVSLGKWFARQRGRANSVMSLGYLMGEACLPFIAVVLIGVLGWRSVWGLAAGAALVCACVLPWL